MIKMKQPETRKVICCQCGEEFIKRDEITNCKCDKCRLKDVANNFSKNMGYIFYWGDGTPIKLNLKGGNCEEKG